MLLSYIARKEAKGPTLVRLDNLFFVNLFFVLFMGPLVLFQLTFTFIYSFFNKKFSASAK